MLMAAHRNAQVAQDVRQSISALWWLHGVFHYCIAVQLARIALPPAPEGGLVRRSLVHLPDMQLPAGPSAGFQHALYAALPTGAKADWSFQGVLSTT